MDTVADIMSFVIVIALLALVVPALWEVIGFCLALFVQIALCYIIAAFVISVIYEYFGDRNEGQRAYSF